MPRNKTVLKVVGIFAAVGYIVAIGLRISPASVELSPLVVFAVCPPAMLSFTVDPSLYSVIVVLAPLNAVLYSVLGLVCWLAYKDTRGT
jgi:hypothetical protein